MCASKRIDCASVSQSRRVAARPIAAAPATATAKHLRAIDATETAILVGGRWLHLLRFRAGGARGALPLTCRALSQSLLDMTSLC